MKITILKSFCVIVQNFKNDTQHAKRGESLFVICMMYIYIYIYPMNEEKNRNEKAEKLKNQKRHNNNISPSAIC